jgi:hypothetical protein
MQIQNRYPFSHNFAKYEKPFSHLRDSWLSQPVSTTPRCEDSKSLHTSNPHKTRLASRDGTSSCVVAFVASRLVLLFVLVLSISRPTAVEHSPSPQIVPETTVSSHIPSSLFHRLTRDCVIEASWLSKTQMRRTALHCSWVRLPCLQTLRLDQRRAFDCHSHQ